MNIEYVDARKDLSKHQRKQGEKQIGELQVQNAFIDVAEWKLGPAKPGDVGMDIPVRIKNMDKHNSGGLGSSLRISPHSDYYINYDEGWVDIPPHGYAELPSNLKVKVPDDAWGMIKPRSSTGWRLHIEIFEGVIDTEFTGMLCCLAFNPNNEPVRVKDGDRLAQIILVPKYPLKRIITVNELPKTVRCESGFGSTNYGGGK